MKKLLACGAMLAAAAVSAATAATPKYAAEAFYKTTDYLLATPDGAYSPDGSRLLITSNATGIFNVYELDLASGSQTALTNSSTNAAYAVSYFPDGMRFLYTADRGGDELNHLYVAARGADPVDLTPGDKVKAGFVGWIEGGEAFIVETNERDPRYYDLYRYDADDYAREMIYENTLGLLGFEVSADGAYAAAVKPESSADDNIYLVSLKGEAAPVLITPHEGAVSHAIYTFTPAGDKLVYGTNEFGEFTEAWTHDVATGEKAKLISAEWDVMNVAFSPSGRYRLHAVNDDASTALTIVDQKSGKAVRMPDGLPKGDVTAVRFAPDEKSIAFLLNADVSPSNIFSAEIGKKKFRQHTQALNPDIDPANLVESSVVRYKSFDGLDIPGVLYIPKDASAENPAPALVWVHGGPGGQSRTGYNATLQHLVNHGYAVLAANNRGSSGYGKTFYHMDDKKHGEVDLQDIVYARTYLESLEMIDDERIGVIGGSYGGYMTMAALAFTPDAFDVGINIFGVTNWLRTLVSIPPWWEAQKKALYDELGDPATDEERLRRISPLFHAKNVKKPLLVVQGANDPRVLQIESDEIVAAVKKNGVPVEYIVFPDEGHGFRNRANRITASEAYVKLLDTHLRGVSAGGSDAGE